MSFRCEEVNNASRDDNSNRKNNVSDDMDVGCFDVDVVLELIIRCKWWFGLYLLVRGRGRRNLVRHADWGLFCVGGLDVRVAASLMMLIVFGLRKMTATLVWMFMLAMFMLMMFMIVVVTMMFVMIVRAARTMFMFLHLWCIVMIVSTWSMLSMMMFLSMSCYVIMRAIMVSSGMHVAVQHIHDKQIADQSNEWCQ